MLRLPTTSFYPRESSSDVRGGHPAADSVDDHEFVEDSLSDSEIESLSDEASSSAKRKRKKDDGHIRRPANPFILFASSYRKSLQTGNKDNRELSREAGVLWKVMTKEEKDTWKREAERVKEKHAKDHPDYRYRPRRRDGPQHPQLPAEEKKRPGIGFLPPLLAEPPRSRKSGSSSKHGDHSSQTPARTEHDPASSFVTDSQPPRSIMSINNLVRPPPSYNSQIPGKRQPMHRTAPPPLKSCLKRTSRPSTTSVAQSGMDNDVSRFFGMLTRDPNEIEPARLDFGDYDISNVPPAIWDNTFISAPSNSLETRQHTPTSPARNVNDNALIFTQFDLSSFSNPYMSNSTAFDSNFNMFHNNGGPSRQ